MATITYSPEYLAQSRVTVLYVFYSIPIPLELLSTALRLYVKARSMKGGLSFDDVLIVFATAVSVALCISGLVYGPPYGLGRHVQAVPPEDLKTFLMGDYIFSHLYDVAIASTKLSVLALYYRVFSTALFRSFIVVTVCFILAWLVTMEVVLGLECRPIQAWWGAVEGVCLNQVAFAYFTNITNLIADFWIFLMPIPIILRLQTKQQKKITLLFLFSIGLGTCALSASRLHWVFSEGSTDITWDEIPLGILSAWEPCGGILCANLPIIYGFLTQTVTHLRSSMRGGSSGARAWQPSRPPQSKSTQHPVTGTSQAEWIRLDGGSGVTSSEVLISGQRRRTTDMEAQMLDPTSIRVERGLSVRSEQNEDAKELCLDDK